MAKQSNLLVFVITTWCTLTQLPEVSASVIPTQTASASIPLLPDTGEDIRQRMMYRTQQRSRRRKCWKAFGSVMGDVTSGVDLTSIGPYHPANNLNCLSIAQALENIYFIQGQVTGYE